MLYTDGSSFPGMHRLEHMGQTLLQGVCCFPHGMYLYTFLNI